LETVSVLREAWPENLPFSVRLSCSDWVDGGWTIQEAIELSKKLKERGADMIDCSSGFGTPDHKRYPFAPGWQVPFSEAIRKQAGVATAAVGLITEPVQADEIIRKDQADLVLLARQMLRDPYWPYRAAIALNEKEKVRGPAAYAHWI
jgi:2,4-dienoyl-CoA reductase-like NADH-dependent reductase (Old Yellow Enzyme family)